MLRHSYCRYRREHGKLIDAGRWYEACTEFTAAGVFEALMRVEADAPRGSARIWGDKSPSYLDDIPLLKRLFPAAEVLHILRGARDPCRSIRKAWGKDMLRAAQRWADGVRKARQAGAALGADYLELRYEDLLARTEPELRRVCAFLGVAFEPDMLTLVRPSENLGDARGARQVLDGNRDKFRRAMAPETVARIEQLAGAVLLACGYQVGRASR